MPKWPEARVDLGTQYLRCVGDSGGTRRAKEAFRRRFRSTDSPIATPRATFLLERRTGAVRSIHGGFSLVLLLFECLTDALEALQGAKARREQTKGRH